jgi:hypothetical protein
VLEVAGVDAADGELFVHTAVRVDQQVHPVADVHLELARQRQTDQHTLAVVRLEEFAGKQTLAKALVGLRVRIDAHDLYAA